MRRKPVSTNSHDGPADLPSNAKLRAFRCQDFSDMSRKDRVAYANAVHAAIRADNQRRGQSYAPAFRTIGECQVAYDRHMAEQRDRQTNVRQELAASIAEQWAKDRVAAAVKATKASRLGRKPQHRLPNDSSEGLCRPIAIEPTPVKPSILPALLAEHFDQGARKLAAHLVANTQQSAIYAAISRTCYTLGI